VAVRTGPPLTTSPPSARPDNVTVRAPTATVCGSMRTSYRPATGSGFRSRLSGWVDDSDHSSTNVSPTGLVTVTYAELGSELPVKPRISDCPADASKLSRAS
jgi:hypothetical protein